MKLAINIILTLIVLGMAYYLYSSIRAPIEFKKAYKVRKEATIDRLKQIREAQLAYRKLNDRFADNFDSLIHSLESDSLPRVKILGNPDDTTVETTYDTTYQPLWQNAFDKKVAFDSLRYIPYSGGKEFHIDAGSKEKNKVEIQVFEVAAPDSLWLKGLNRSFLQDPKTLQVGSMEKGTYSGNWGE